MKKLLHSITDWVSTKRGMWITIIAWLVLMIGLSAGPKLGDYKTNNFQSLPDEAKSIIAENKTEEYFPNKQGTPGILVFHNENGEVDIEEAKQILEGITLEDIDGIKTIIDISKLPPQALGSFISEDKSTMIVPMELENGLGNDQYAEINDLASEAGNNIAEDLESTAFYITGPAGIAGDTVKLFEQADFVLLIATVLIILVLLIAIYRSPLLAVIPLLATAIVYQVVNQSIALMGAGGLEVNNQTTSIMSILLFAAVIDYSLFVFSRYREELNHYENKYIAMKHAMRATGEPVFFAGGTVLAAMLVLFFADFRDYQNFAPIFGTAMFFIMLASVTLVPALFTLFGRKAFWPKVPQYGTETEVKHKVWGPLARFVVNKPGLSGGMVGIFMLITALNIFNLDYEFDMVKKFPDDLPSRVGYEIVESRFDKGELAPSTLLVVSNQKLDETDASAITEKLQGFDEIASVRLSALSEDGKAAKMSVALSINPYSTEALAFMENLRDDTPELLQEAGLEAESYYSGVTAKIVDEQDINNGDIIKIVLLETVLILALLFALTKSVKMPIYMMATILLSFVSALGLGIFLVDVLFGFESISSRVPVYSFIFLVALGIDYNIILVSRFIEERKTHRVKNALEIAIRNTGGVISSAGLILAATFAALMTMPIADLFVFGFIVAMGILIDTFLVRGMLLPALILFFEKDKETSRQKISE
ncbi:MMPL family transporter [Cytobacillus oceanisediminis]|uniref:MMPL family transporter n=1 Tax=Cytobacillus TaxID=2675230 RepID=UPI00203FBD3F|nr:MULTISPECIES: MMPL family transporter [Cytobacillus]MCM3394579.1 MMPL family transporter [Cytobacillus oceanisediminis]MCM3530325.1 MMPL family transporter [Cytobacillus oceanisediminis]UQX55003.1 MMPL family transporter [Cytobacillus pseudoceanisediminis]